MALRIASGSFNIGTGAAGSTVTISPGFTAKCGILWWGGRTESADAAGSASVRRGFGFFVGTSSFRAGAHFDQDAVGTSVVGGGTRGDAVILECDGAANVGWADIQSISSTDVVFEVLDQFVTNLRVSYLIFGGDDIEGEIVESLIPASTGNQTINTTRVPKLIMLMAPRCDDTTPFIAGAATGFGMATATEQYVWSGGAIDADANSTTGSYCRAGECVAIWEAVAVEARASLVSFNTGTPGFTLNWAEGGGAVDGDDGELYTLVLSGPFQAHLGDFVTLTSLGTITETGIPFTPEALMFVSHNKAQSTVDTQQAHDELSVGVAVSTANRMVQQSSSRDGNTTMFCQAAIQFDEVYVNMSVTADTIEGSADIASITANGFTLDQDDADPVAAFVWYLALASEPTPWTQPVQGIGSMRRSHTEFARRALMATSPARPFVAEVVAEPDTIAQPVQGTAELKQAQTEFWTHAALAAQAQPYGDFTEGPVENQPDTIQQPVVGTDSLVRALTAFRGRAVQAWQLAQVVNDEAAAEAGEPGVQPVQGTFGVSVSARSFWTRATTTQGQRSTVTGDVEPFVEQENTYQGWYPGAHHLDGSSALHAEWKRFYRRAVRAAQAAPYGDFGDGPLDAQPDTWAQPTPGTHLLRQQQAEFQRRAALASATYYTGGITSPPGVVGHNNIQPSITVYIWRRIA